MSLRKCLGLGAKVKQVTYNHKVFKYNATIPNRYKDKAIQRNNIIFQNCTFSKLIIKSTGKEIKKIDIISGSIEELTVQDCEVHGKFYINKQYGKNKESIRIKKLMIKDTIFHENFKLHHANVTEVSIEDTDFEKHADFFKSTFDKGTLEDDTSEETYKEEIGFKAINFKGLALFGDTEFKKSSFLSMLHLKVSVILEKQS